MLGNPAPLELSYNTCSYSCSYCFATANERPFETKLTAGPTMGHIAKVFREGGNPHNLADQLLLAKRAIVFSNAVDPCSFRNLKTTRDTLPQLQKLEVPVVLQTRGTRKVSEFGEILDMLPEGSLCYFSITSFDPVVLKEVEKGCPSNEERLEMLAMAKARGFQTVAALNPVDIDWVGDPFEFIARCVEIAGPDTIDGTWIELLHLKRDQADVMIKKHKGVLPVIAEGAVARATARPWVIRTQPFEDAPDHPFIDHYWVEDLLAAVGQTIPRLYSASLKDFTRGRADVFDLWPNPWITHHALVAACQEVSAQAGGAPVGVTFQTAMSWIDPYREWLDQEISVGDWWSWVNCQNNLDAVERQTLRAMTKTVSIEETLKFLWQHPGIGVHGIYGAYGLKALVATTGIDGKGKPVLETLPWSENDGLLVVYAPDHGGLEEVGLARHKDHLVHLADVEDDLVMLEAFEPSEEADGDAAATAG